MMISFCIWCRNKELPPWMDRLDQEIFEFITFPSDCLIGMHNPCFDLVDQAFNLSDMMSLQAEYIWMSWIWNSRKKLVPQ